MQTFTGLEYLKIDIASNFGLDKKLWSERLAWFEDNKHHLLSLHKQAKDPALYFAGVRAYDATMAGQPSGYPISLDATASGLQVLSVMTGDRAAARLCNVVDVGNRENAYEAIFKTMCKTATAEGLDAGTIDPDELKRAVMTSCYGSEAVPKEVFGEGTLFEIFLETMETEAPGVWELNKEFLKQWNPEAMSNDWTLPDNFHVHVKVMATLGTTVEFLGQDYTTFRKVNMPTEDGRSLGANVTHSIDGLIVREMLRRCMYDAGWIQLIRDTLSGDSAHYFQFGPIKDEATKMVNILWEHYERTGFLSARILQYLDSDTIQLVDSLVIEKLVCSLPAKPFNVLTTHDCFRFLPNYGNDIRKQYNQLLHEIAKSELLGDLLTQITGRVWTINKLDPSLADDILDAEYALS